MDIRRGPGRMKNAVRAEDRASVLEAAECRFCGDRIGPFEVEHVVPLSRSGTNERSNLACACVSCNTQKGNYLLHEWAQWRKTHGMSWPPVAQHATDPQHFPDYCRDCRDAGFRPNVFKARRLEPSGAGYRCHYLCPKGHTWSCWYRIDDRYYSDCECAYCVSRRLEETV